MTGIAGSATYSVYRATTTGAETLLQSGLTATSFADTGLIGGLYFYKVTATLAGSESALSNEASATASDFTLSANPTAITVPAGGTTTSAITVNPLGGFSGQVALTQTTTPDGITAAAATAGTSTPVSVSITAAATVTPNTYTLTESGYAYDPTGTVTHTIPLTVIVTAPPVIGVQTGAWQPNPALVGQTITSTVTGSVLANPYQAPNGDSVTQNWTWTTGNVYVSSTGAPGTFAAASNYSIGWSQGSASTSFSGSFINPGYYIVGVTATLTYHDNTTGQSFGPYSGSGYIGGSASDLAASGNTASPLASGSQAVQPQGTSTVDGIGVLPLTIGILGTNNPAAGDYRALTGQQITASLVLPIGYPSGTKITGYTWSFSNNNPIKGWDPNAPGDGQPTQILPLLPTDYVGYPPIGSTTVSVQPILFYDEIANDTVTVNCAITLQFPDYTTQTINATSPQVTFLKPTASWTAYTTGPFITSSGGYGATEYWNPATIAVPSPFTGRAGDLGCFVQLITPSSQATRTLPPGVSIMSAATTYYAKVPDGNGGWMLPLQGLDTLFPYPFGTNASSGAQVNSNYTWDVNSQGESGDRPTAPYYPAALPGDMGGTNWYTATTRDKFTTWIMYKPAGGIWVPLQYLSWGTNITVLDTNSSWFVTSGSTLTTAPSGTNTNASPTWTTVNKASEAQMRP